MRRFTQPIWALCLSPCLLMPTSGNADVLEKAQEWLNQYAEQDNTFTLSLTKNKIKFKGCKQKQYQLTFNQQLSSQFNIQAIVHYNKGLLDYGVLSQRVRSHEFEVVSWWDTGDFRLGLSHKVRPRHEISIPVADTIALPTSTTAGLYLEVPFKNNQHIVTFGALQESWNADSASFALPWRTSRDSQLTVQYAITF